MKLEVNTARRSESQVVGRTVTEETERGPTAASEYGHSQPQAEPLVHDSYVALGSSHSPPRRLTHALSQSTPTIPTMRAVPIIPTATRGDPHRNMTIVGTGTKFLAGSSGPVMLHVKEIIKS